MKKVLNFWVPALLFWTIRWTDWAKRLGMRTQFTDARLSGGDSILNRFVVKTMDLNPLNPFERWLFGPTIETTVRFRQNLQQPSVS